jgi:hypothetical protein
MTQKEKDELKKGAPVIGNEDDFEDEVDDTEDTDTAVSKTTAKAGVKGGKKVEISEDMLRELIDSNKELKRTVDQLSSNAVATSNNGVQVRRKTRDFDYFLRKWGNDIVTGFVNKGTDKRPMYVYSIYNKETRLQEQFVDLLLQNGKTVEKIDYITFLRDAEKVKARMISKVEHEDVKEYGMIPKKEMAETGYGMYETMVMVPVEVITKTYTMTLKLPEDEGGEEVSVNSQWLNL